MRRFGKLVAFGLYFWWYERTLNFFNSWRANVFLLNFRLLNPSWLINNICAFWNMPLSYIRSIFSATVFTRNVMIVVWRRRWRKSSNVSSFLLELFHLSHCFHRVLKLFVLDFPFCWFTIKGPFIFTDIWLERRVNRIHLLLYFWYFWLFTLFTHFLMFTHSVRIKSPTTFTTWN